MERAHTPPPPADELFGYAVHHTFRARFCIERGVSGRRSTGSVVRAIVRLAWLVAAAACLPITAEALTIFLRRCAAFKSTLVTSLEREELLGALANVINGLLSESDEVQELVEKVEPQLRELP